MGPRGCPVAWATLQPPPRPRGPSWLILCPTWPWPMGAASLRRARSWWIRTSTASSLSPSSSITSLWTPCTWAKSWACSSFPTYTRTGRCSTSRTRRWPPALTSTLLTSTFQPWLSSPTSWWLAWRWGPRIGSLPTSWGCRRARRWPG